MEDFETFLKSVDLNTIGDGTELQNLEVTSEFNVNNLIPLESPLVEDEFIYPYEEDRNLVKDIDLLSYYHFTLSHPQETLDFSFNYTTGKISHVETVNEDYLSPESSQSILRGFGNLSSFVRGDSGHSPFLPGGVEITQEVPLEIESHQDFDELINNIEANSLFEELNFGIGFDEKGIPFVVRSGDKSVKEDANTVLHTYQNMRDENYYRSAYSQHVDEECKRDQRLQSARDLAYQSDIIPEELENYENQIDNKEDTYLVQDIAKSKTEDLQEWLANQKRRGDTNYSEWVVTERIANIGLDFHRLVPDPAIIYPFEMDDFQKEAVYRLENEESVFIAAHTSAGKTLVGEYAIALAMKHMTRVIYTSPIKALSNQKYRDFKNIFDDVGIITGDISVKPDATCLIVTTEILRSILYKGADLIRDVEWVIFDEVHYINDSERGVVWEEVIIMLPDHVNMIFLSATVPNTFAFADWVGRAKKKKIYVISTNRRPIPLEHYLYYDKELFKIADSSGYLTMGYQSAANAQREKQNKKKHIHKRTGGNQLSWIPVVKTMKKRGLLPAVVFCFSRKRGLSIAESVASGIWLTTSSERSKIISFIDISLKKLKGTDRQLPQVKQLRKLLIHGIGVHNSGFLPILKEIVEILFSKGLVKILFATETFAMGINMPTRTVIFESIRKHDGESFRDLLSGEYIQMSGRAGRRGADTVGTVIIRCLNEIPPPLSLRRMITGRATLLESQFRLTYSMILNLFKLGTNFKVEDMIRKSFFESTNQREFNKLKEKLKKGEELLLEYDDMEGDPNDVDSPASIIQYTELIEEEKRLRQDMNAWIMASPYGAKILEIGRIVTVQLGNLMNAIAVVVRSLGKIPMDKSVIDISDLSKHIRLLVLTGKASNKVSDQYTLLTESTTKGFIKSITKETLKRVDSDRVEKHDERYIKLLIANIDDVVLPFKPGTPPSLNPISDLKIKDTPIRNLNNKIKEVVDIYKSMKCHTWPNRNELMVKRLRYLKLLDQVEALRYLTNDANLRLSPDYEMRVQVLQKLGFISQEKLVLVKGRVARELTNAEELIATEMIFENVLTDLEPAEIASLLSCLVMEGKSDNEPALSDRLEEAYEKVTKIATGLANLQLEYGIKTTPHDYIKENVNKGLMEVVYQWALQKPFKDVIKLTDIPEGIVVRTIVRLDETCRDFRKAAKIIGDIELSQKMAEASLLIKRDVIFASSLYISEHTKKVETIVEEDQEDIKEEEEEEIMEDIEENPEDESDIYIYDE